MTTAHQFEASITAVPGFKCAGAHIGLKRKNKDLALIVSEVPCEWAGTFTTNSVKAAPVIWNQELLAAGAPVKAIVVNSAIANSCTGAAGYEHTKKMAQATADCFDIAQQEVLVASTGVIGPFLPIDLVTEGIRSTAPQIAATHDAAIDAAKAIQTTDSFVKQCAVQFEIGGKQITLAALAKGSGMVHPNMATMLSFIVTDLNISKSMLQAALSVSVAQTYNMISVDGDSSTNDMVLMLANGVAGNKQINEDGDDFKIFVAALNQLNTHLAKLIASDGEGATKLVEVKVDGAANLDDARRLARSVVKSNLVKTSFFAADANWGRIVAALGSAGIAFNLEKLCLSIATEDEELPLLVDGMPYWIDAEANAPILSASSVTITIELGGGDFAATAWGCDLTPEYLARSGSTQRLKKFDGSGHLKEVVA